MEYENGGDDVSDDIVYCVLIEGITPYDKRFEEL